ncbi:type III-B CRISPR module RAMP protein Cmr6 [Micromonospora musae]|uniref:Type III-B CRISPR module RAMP protein Cmr6 n=1 Tax=Micromonospora musae TaxID=1894970 RepID=A0A3A9Y9S0_9ACTN|nr:type III-B CRISPR module RAMP protein Cmr6 [Micromonospora musae]RKN33832.1 type III-B CRISPR module RAMP protein Cmr6 [Micromonospora musae]
MTGQDAKAEKKFPRRAAAGPIGRVLWTGDLLIRGHGGALGAGANPLVVLHRAAFVSGKGVFDTTTEAAVLRWAADTGLGQEPGLLAVAARRRTRALEALVRQSKGRLVWQRRHVTPQWRMTVGVGNRLNPYEIGLSLHGTYGWPIIPGSTIKGLTRAWARECGVDRDDPQRFDRIFGLPRAQTTADTDAPASPPEIDGGDSRGGGGGGKSAVRGSVVFLDALPAGGPVSVTRDVVTPHQQPYYDDEQRLAPGEHHQPIPSEFLVVDGGAFAIDLVGPAGVPGSGTCTSATVDDDVTVASAWCAAAVDELGVGAKTSAGYGYLTVREDQP